MGNTLSKIAYHFLPVSSIMALNKKEYVDFDYLRKALPDSDIDYINSRCKQSAFVINMVGDAAQVTFGMGAYVISNLEFPDLLDYSFLFVFGIGCLAGTALKSISGRIFYGDRLKFAKKYAKYVIRKNLVNQAVESELEKRLAVIEDL